MESENAKHAKVFRAFCDGNRLAILHMLCGGEKCACQLRDELSIGQPTLSHHMKILCESGIVNARKEGKWTYYAIGPKAKELGLQLMAQYTEVAGDEPCRDCRE